MSYTTIITAAELADLDKVIILDCRAALGDPDYGARVFAEAHLPGAAYLSLDDDLAAAPGSGGRHPLPDPKTLAARLAALGCNNDQQIVVYDDAGGAFASRAWWCLRWLGHEAVAVLDGGFNAWAGELTSAVTEVVPGDFSQRKSITRTIDAAELMGQLSSITMLDARAQARFDGLEEPIDPVAGHIPGAFCMPFQGNLDDAGRFRSAAELAARFSEFNDADPLVCYCGSGVTAAHNILALRIAGFAEPVLYPGSWSEWIVDTERPVATA